MKTRLNYVLVLWLALSLLAAAPYKLLAGEPFGGCNCSAGYLDETFDSDGKTTGGWAYADDIARAVAVQQDGKIVLAGYTDNFGNERFEILRFTADGAPDGSFGLGGLVTTSFGNTSDYANSVAIQADGKIVVAGHREGVGFKDIAVARYNSNGSLVTTFDADGMATFDLGSSASQGSSVAIQSDGKIIIAGECMRTHNNIALVRLNSNGSLDAAFNGGYVTTAVGSVDAYSTAMAIQPDGKIVLAGIASDGSAMDIVLARYNNNGSLDTSFSSAGIVVTDLSTYDRAYGVALQSNGKIIVAGSMDDYGVFVGYSSSGSQLSSVYVGEASRFLAIAIQPNDKILGIGYKYFTDIGYDIAVTRLNHDLSVDSSFQTGTVLTNFGNIWNIGYAAAIQPDGKIVVAGYTMPDTGMGDFALVRYWGDRYVFLPMLTK